MARGFCFDANGRQIIYLPQRCRSPPMMGQGVVVTTWCARLARVSASRVACSRSPAFVFNAAEAVVGFDCEALEQCRGGACGRL